MGIRKLSRRFMLIFCVLLLAVSLAFAFVACSPGNEEGNADYYLSMASGNWQTFSSKESIPENLHFKSQGNEVYKLSINLAEGELFTINKLNSNEKYGYEQLFTVAEDLTSGENGSVRVAHGGAFDLFYNAVENVITYSYHAPAPSPVSGVMLDKKELSMELNSTAQLVATVQPDNAENKSVTWSSSDDGIVAVTQDGAITAVGYGTATITVTTVQNSYTTTCAVTVLKHLQSMRFDRDSLALTAEGQEKTLHLHFAPDDASDTEYSLQITEGEDVISATKGEDGVVAVSGLKAGQAVLKAVSEENEDYTAVCTVTVYDAGTVLVDMPQYAQTMIEESIELDVSLENGNIEQVNWTVSNDAIATVVGNGSKAVVTGVEFGKAVVTATITDSDGNQHVSSCDVIVADDYFFIYGYNLVEEGDWKYENYINNRNAAEAAGLLLTETSTPGIYTLTRHLTPEQGFQIIFPQVASYEEKDLTTGKTVWNKNIPSDIVGATSYYKGLLSDIEYVSNAESYFKVNAAGVYTITLDMTTYTVGSGFSAQKYCCVYINMVSLDVASANLTLKEGDAVLKSGNSVDFDFSVNPSAAMFTEEQVEIKLDSAYSDFAQYVDYVLNFADRTISVTAKGTIPDEFTVTLTLTVRGVSASVDLYILPSDADKTPVTEVTFDQSKYEHNVNNGEGNWTTKVKASADAAATNNQVRYYDVTDYDAYPGSSVHAVVNEITGEVTAKSLGTYKIMAVALDDPTKTATVEVLFYSDVFYMVGKGYGTWDALEQSVTSLDGSDKANYAFTKDAESNLIYTLTYDTSKFGYGDSHQMKIVFLGIDLQWTGQINATNIAQKFSNVYYGWHIPELYGDHGDIVSEGQQNIQFLNRGVYTLTIDLSRSAPMLIIDLESRELAKDYVLEYHGSSNLHQGDSVSAELVTVPFKHYQNSDVTVEFDGNDGYLSYAFDPEVNMLTFTVDKAEHSEDKTVTVQVTADGDTQTLTFKIVAEHHLELAQDDDAHWYRCTDDGCDYIENDQGEEGKTSSHSKGTSLSADADGHFYACSVCGRKFNFEPHKYELSDGVFDFDASKMGECTECHYKLFVINGNTLVEYHGKAAIVEVPSNVTIIGDHAFDGHSEIVTLTYKGRWTSIGAYAFAGCSSLTQISIDNRVTTIGAFAFKGCAAQIVWGSNPAIRTIGENAFNGYLGTELNIPVAVTKILGYAFANSNLISVTIPNNAVFGNTGELRNGAFQNCKMLVSVVLGTKIYTIPPATFEGCESLEYVLIRGSEFYAFGENVFSGCNSLRGVYIERDASNFTGSKPIVNIGIDAGNGALIGKLYFYTESTPSASMTFEAYANYFAGLWHYKDIAHKNLENVEQWPAENETATVSTLTALAVGGDKRKLVAPVK